MNLIFYPDGLAVESVAIRQRRRSKRKARRLALEFEKHEAAGITGIESVEESASAGSSLSVTGVPTAKGSSTQPVLVIDDVSVVYGSVVAVSHVSIELKPGEVVGLIGPNGAGKTSLIDAVFGMAPTRSGQIVLDGRPLVRLPPHRRSRLGLRRTFQGAELFDDLTVWDNIAVSASSPERAEAIVARLGIGEFRDVLARDVPAGLRRRVDLARALAGDPKVVLLDEPGAGLSAQDKQAVAAQLNELAESENLAFLLVDHDVDFVAAACHRAYALALGELIAEGDTSAVLQSEPVMEAYLGLAVTTV